jgi:hypothetical protein
LLPVWFPSQVGHVPPNVFDQFLQLWVGVLPQVDESAVELDRLLAVTAGFVQFSEPA